MCKSCVNFDSIISVWIVGRKSSISYAYQYSGMIIWQLLTNRPVPHHQQHHPTSSNIIQHHPIYMFNLLLQGSDTIFFFFPKDSCKPYYIYQHNRKFFRYQKSFYRSQINVQTYHTVSERKYIVSSIYQLCLQCEINANTCISIHVILS